jgi:hypothetical protein
VLETTIWDYFGSACSGDSLASAFGLQGEAGSLVKLGEVARGGGFLAAGDEVLNSGCLEIYVDTRWHYHHLHPQRSTARPGTARTSLAFTLITYSLREHGDQLVAASSHALVTVGWAAGGVW